MSFFVLVCVCIYISNLFIRILHAAVMAQFALCSTIIMYFDIFFFFYKSFVCNAWIQE